GLKDGTFERIPAVESVQEWDGYIDAMNRAARDLGIPNASLRTLAPQCYREAIRERERIREVAETEFLTVRPRCHNVDQLNEARIDRCIAELDILLSRDCQLRGAKDLVTRLTLRA